MNQTVGGEQFARVIPGECPGSLVSGHVNNHSSIPVFREYCFHPVTHGEVVLALGEREKLDFAFGKRGLQVFADEARASGNQDLLLYCCRHEIKSVLRKSLYESSWNT